jgi:hypothetical protein
MGGEGIFERNIKVEKKLLRKRRNIPVNVFVYTP